MKVLSKGAKIALDIALIVFLVMFFVAAQMILVNEVTTNRTEVIKVGDGTISPSVKQNLVLGNSGNAQFFAKWWPEEDLGYITAVILRDMNNEMLFYSTGNKLECWSKEMRLKKGTYEVELVFFGNDSDFKTYFENIGVDTSGWEVADCFKEGTYTVNYEFGIKGSSSAITGIGIITILFLIIIASHLAIVITSNSGNTKAYYDERQLLARGQASNASTYSMLTYFGIYFLLKMGEFYLPLPDTIMIFGGVLLGFVVLATLCIWNNAYIALNQKPKSTLGLLTIVCGINLMSAIVNFTNAYRSEYFRRIELIENLQFRTGLINLMMALALLYVIILYVVRMRLDARED